MEYFSDDQIAQLISRLARLTSSDRLQWQTVGDSEFEFTSTVGETGFIVESKDRDDMAPHILSIYSIGQSTRLLQQVDSTNLISTDAEDLDDLYLSVKRKTLQLDVITQNILNDLDRLLED